MHLDGASDGAASTDEQQDAPEAERTCSRHQYFHNNHRRLHSGDTSNAFNNQSVNVNNNDDNGNDRPTTMVRVFAAGDVDSSLVRPPPAPADFATTPTAAAAAAQPLHGSGNGSGVVLLRPACSRHHQHNDQHNKYNNQLNQHQKTVAKDVSFWKRMLRASLGRIVSVDPAPRPCLLDADYEASIARKLRLPLHELDDILKQLEPVLARTSLVASSSSSSSTTSSSSLSSSAAEPPTKITTPLPHIDVGDLHSKYGVCFKTIGHGNGGVVRLFKRKQDNTIFAVKEFRKRKSGESKLSYMECLTREYFIGSLLHHPNVVETLDLVIDHGRCYEVMEYCIIDLFQVIQSGFYGIPEINCCFKQLINGVAYLHSLGIAHRDLKPENLCFDRNARLKIIDFGVSDICETSAHVPRKSRGLCGSAPYIAPEAWIRSEYDAQKVDWETATESDKNFQLFQTHISSPTSLHSPNPFFQPLDPSSHTLMSRILALDPDCRITTRDILQDTWFDTIVVCKSCGDACCHNHFTQSIVT